MKKRVLALLLAMVLTMSFALTGCGGGGSSSSTSSSSSSGSSDSSAPEDSSSESSSEPATGDVSWDTSKNDEIVVSVINNYYTSGWQKMAEEYTKLHPETKVIVDVVADNDTYTQKMTTWLTADDFSDAADIVHVNFAAGPVGGYNVMFEKDMIYDLNDMLDETNPYGGGLVRDEFKAEDLKLYQDSGRLYSLPFDWVGVAIMYNNDILQANNIDVNTLGDWDTFLAACQTLKDGGMQAPIAATGEASWFIAALADAALRNDPIYPELLTQETDARYNADTMQANVGFKFNEDDWSCDRFVTMDGERMAAYKQEHACKDATAIGVWEKFAEFGKYFQTNYVASASTEVVTSFELGNSAFLLSGSWNVGQLNSDIAEMGDEGFEWGTISFPNFATAPEGFSSSAIRGLYVQGNTMGIIKTGDDDHLERVKDFFKYVYCKNGCQTMFDTTLNDGYWVQGPPAIKGVELSPELTAKLEGFVQEGTLQGNFGGMVGQTAYLQEDKGAYDDATNKLLSGEITAEEFCEIISPIALRQNADTIEKNGYDLDPTTMDEVKS